MRRFAPATLLLAAGVAAAPLAMREKSPMGGTSTSTSFLVGDLDGNGIAELLGKEGPQEVLELDAASGRFFVRREIAAAVGIGASPRVLADTDGDGLPEVVRASGSGVVQIADPRTGAVVSNTWVPLQILAVTAGDLDGVPGDEIVLADRDGIHVLRPGEDVPEWSLRFPATVTGLAIGQTDADPAPEIAVAASGRDVAIVDAELRTISWLRSPDTPETLSLVDVDADGLDEVVVSDYDTVVIDADRSSVKWRLRAHHVVGTGDVDGDGRADIVGQPAGHGQPLLILDGWTGDLVSELAMDLKSVASVAIADVSGDCRADLVWTGKGWDDSDLAGGLDLAAARPLAIETLVFVTVTVADVESDGRMDVACARYLAHPATGSAECRVEVEPRATRERRALPSEVVPRPWGGALAAVQVDADPWLELIALTCHESQGGRLAARDGVTGDDEWVHVVAPCSPPGTILAEDFDSDGDLELLVVARGRVEIREAATGVLIHALPGESWVDARVADLDGDGSREIVAARLDGPDRLARVVTIDPVTFQETREHEPGTSTVGAMDVAPIVPGELPLVVMTIQSEIRVLDPLTDTILLTWWLSDIGAWQLRVAELDGVPPAEIVALVNDGGWTRLRVLDGGDLTERWRGPVMNAAHFLDVADTDDDGDLEILVIEGGTIRMFEAMPPADLDPPTFAGLAAAGSTPCCHSIELDWDPAIDSESPPMTYEIHRGTDPAFAIDASTRVGIATASPWRDASAPAGTLLWYAVRARDAAGNAEANASRVAVTSRSSAPVTPVVTITQPTCDPATCLIQVDPPVAPAGGWFDLVVDGRVVATNVSSPITWTLPDAAPHDIAIAIEGAACPHGVTSLRHPIIVPQENPVLLSVDDVDPCLVSGFLVSFERAHHPPGLLRHDLVVDGVVVGTDIASPYWLPGSDARIHAIEVRAVDVACGSVTSSARLVVVDDSAHVIAPGIVLLDDTDTCASSEAVLVFSLAVMDGPSHHELWRDGALFLTPVSPGSTFAAGDLSSHEYVVRAVHDGCGQHADALPVLFADSDACDAATFELDIRLELVGPLVRVSWPFAPPAVTAFDAHVGSIAAIATGVPDHLPAHPGMEFPDAPDRASGCGAAAAGATFLDVDGLPANSYVLVVARGASGETGPFGRRSDGLDRGDPAVDPRPPACP